MNKLIIVFACLALGACGKDKLVAPLCPDIVKGGVAANSPNSAPVVWDDGYSTYLRFPAGMEVPGVNVLRVDGSERDVRKSFNPDNGVMMLHGIYPTLVLRMSGRVACIRNMSYDPQAPQSVRSIRNNEPGAVW